MENEKKLSFLSKFMSKLNLTKAPGSAKLVTLIVLFGITTIGILGSFNFMDFNMDNYVKFLDKFVWFFLPIITSIGANTAIQKVKESGEK